MQDKPIDGERRQLIKLVGAGLLLGTVGAGSASAGSGRYIVGTTSTAGTREARRQAQSVRRVLDFGQFGQAVAGRFSREALRGLSARADVRYVEPDGLLYAIAIADLDNGDAEIAWGVDRVDAEKVWDTDSDGVVDDTTLAGSGAHIAILDTGIDNDHPDLVDNLGNGIAFAVNPWWVESSTDPADWDDGNGHGTHCAGIAAAVKNGAGVAGVAPAGTLHAVKVLSDSGSGSWSDVAAGIEWAADNGMDVASMSLGGGHSETVQTAVQYAASKGVLLVAAAGNDGPGTADDHYPSAYPEVIAVAATERYQDDSGELFDSLAYFSSTGSVVEIGAPGRAITSTYKGGDYKTMSGTSMACPHVSGAGGLLMAAGYTAADARSQLGGSAETPVYDGEEGRDMTSDEIGNGLLDVQAATGSSSGGDTGDTTAPGSPTLSEDGHTDTSVSLSWTKPADSDLAGFNLYAKLSSDSTYAKEATFDASTTSATVEGLSADTSYDFYVTAYDTSGNESDPSNVVTVKTDTSGTSTGDGTAPTIDQFTATEAGSPNPHATVTVDWAVSDTVDDGSSGTLSSVKIDVIAQDGSYSDTHTHAVSGASASGSDSFEAKWGGGKTYDVTLTVTDAAGNSATATTSVAAA